MKGVPTGARFPVDLDGDIQGEVGRVLCLVGLEENRFVENVSTATREEKTLADFLLLFKYHLLLDLSFYIHDF